MKKSVLTLSHLISDDLMFPRNYFLENSLLKISGSLGKKGFA